MYTEKDSLVYDGAIIFWKIVTQVFFREIRPRGAFNIPREGPVIFVGAPHHNQFVDPLLLSQQVYHETGRRVQFLTAAKSMKRKWVGFFTRLMMSIPVARAADEAKRGTGLVTLSPDDPCLVIGHGTKFMSEFKPRMQILLPKSVGSVVAEVLEVISDSELRLKKEFGGESGKATTRILEKLEEAKAGGKDGLDFKALPYVDQQEMYRHVYQCLQEGRSIGIFPEGGSHDRTDLLPLKAGVSVMALGAMANDPKVKVKIVPVGLSYFHAHRFRSRAVVEFGSALDVPPEYVEMFKEGGTKKREAVGKFLDLVYDALKTVTVRAPDYDTLMVVQAARRLYKTPGQHLTLGQVVELNKRLLAGYEVFKDEPRIVDLRKKVVKYNRLVRDLGLRDHQVPRAQRANWKVLSLLLYRVILLFVWTVLALPGTLLNGPMIITASVLSRKKAKEALAASEVKIAGRDVLATWKILISLGLTPIVYGFYAIVTTLLMLRANAPLQWVIGAPFLLVVSLPFMNFAALKFGEAGFDVLKSLRPLVVSLVPGQQRSLNKLKAMRVQLANEVVDVINEFGPKIYEDFNGSRVLYPSSAAPPSTNNPQGLWRRKTAVGGVDAQGLGLTHPFTWIDERLFGWSRSASRGTSVWAGPDDGSHAPTPAESDNEDHDHGDYDDVLGVISSYATSGTTSGSRSRQTSYADLQKLKMSSIQPPTYSPVASPVVPSSPEADGLHFRTGHGRKPSLSDDIPVQRIAHCDQHDTFERVTQDLNREADNKKHM